MLTETFAQLQAYASQPGANQDYVEFLREELALLAEPERAQGRLYALYGRGRPQLRKAASAAGVLPAVEQLTQAYIDHVLDTWIEHCAAPGDDANFAGDMTALGLLLPEHARVDERDLTSTNAASRAAVRLASDPVRRARVREGFLANFKRRYLATDLLLDERALALEKVRDWRTGQARGMDTSSLVHEAGWGQTGGMDAYDASSVTWHSPGLLPIKQALEQLGIYAQAWEAWRLRLEAALHLWDANTPEGIARRMALENERAQATGRFRQNWLTTLVQETEGSLPRTQVAQVSAIEYLEEVPTRYADTCGHVSLFRVRVTLPEGSATWYALTETHYAWMSKSKKVLSPRSFVFTDLGQAQACQQALTASLEPAPEEAR